MLTAAGFFASSVGFGVVAGMGGDALMGWAAVLMAVAAIITALGLNVGTLRASRQTRAKTEDIATAVGPPNGRTVQQVLTKLEANQGEIRATQDEIHSHHEYQRTRNHDLLGAVGVLVATQPTQIRLIEELVAELAAAKQLMERLAHLIELLTPKET